MAMPRAEVTPDAELNEVLDQELSCLPEMYKAAILLCDMEGKTHREAARVLGCPEGTLASRLTRGRRILAAKLSRRGFAVSAGALAMWMTQEAAAVPPALVDEVAALITGRAVASASVSTITQGVLKMMLISKLKTASAVILVLSSLALVAAAAVGQAPPGPGPQETPKRAKEAKPVESDAEFIRRMCLDLRGTPPSDIEVHYFLQDRNPEKRTWLVDMLRREAAPNRKETVKKQADNVVDMLVREPARGGKDAAKVQAENDMVGLQGEWQLVDVKKGTSSGRPKGLAEFRLSFQGDRLTLHTGIQSAAMRIWKLNLEAMPKLMMLSEPFAQPAKTWAYELNGDLLRIVDADRPLPPDIFKKSHAYIEIMELRRVPEQVELISTRRDLRIPFHVDQSKRASIAAVSLWVSADQGANWRLHDRVKPDAESFTFNAPNDGVFWFKVQVQHRDGRVEPTNLGTVPDTKIRVKATEDDAERGRNN